MIETLLSIDIGIDPTIIDKWGIEITWHGLFTALGVVIGVLVAAYFGRKAGYKEDHIYNAALALVIGGIIGARLLYVVENWSLFEDDVAKIVEVNTGGISIYGALIGGLVGGWLYCIIAKVPDIPKAADIGAIGAIIGMAVGRIGDIINGEHFAKTTDLFWGVIYTNANSPSFIRFGAAAEPQHPAVAYELLGDLVIFAILIFLYTHVKRSGITFFAWIFLYGALRFTVSFLRLDDTILGTGLRTAQVIGIGGMIVGALGIIYLLVVPPKEEAGEGRAARRRAQRGESPGVGEEPAT